MNALLSIGKSLWVIAVGVWWTSAGLILFMAVLWSLPWVIENFEDVRWAPLAYLIWGTIGFLALTYKGVRTAQVSALNERQARRERAT